MQAEERLPKKACCKMRSHKLALERHRKDRIYMVGLENRYKHTTTQLLCSAAAGVLSPWAKSKQTLLGGLRSSGHGPSCSVRHRGGTGLAHCEPSVDQTQQRLWLFPEESPLVKSLLLTNELKPLCFFFFFPPHPVLFAGWQPARLRTARCGRRCSSCRRTTCESPCSDAAGGVVWRVAASR